MVVSLSSSCSWGDSAQTGILTLEGSTYVLVSTCWDCLCHVPYEGNQWMRCNLTFGVLAQGGSQALQEDVACHGCWEHKDFINRMHVKASGRLVSWREVGVARQRELASLQRRSSFCITHCDRVPESPFHFVEEHLKAKEQLYASFSFLGAFS